MLTRAREEMEEHGLMDRLIYRATAWAAGDGWSREWTDRYELET